MGAGFSRPGGAWILEETPSDAIFTPEKLSDVHRLRARTTREFMDHEVAPHLDALEAKDWTRARQMLRRCGELGLLGINVPEAYGGLDLDKSSALVVSERERLWLTSMVVLAALVSIMIGGLQIAGGDQSPLYFYYPTNLGSAVGLFSNRNHQAALLIAALPFAALWVAFGSKSERFKVPLIVAAVSFLLVAIIGLVIVRSRAGVFMLAPSLVASLIIMSMARSARNRKTVAMVGGGVVLALFLAVAFGMGPLLERFSDDQADLRGAIVVASPEGELGALVRTMGGGLAVTPGDVEGLAGAIRSLEADREACAAMGRQARETLDAHFTKASSMARWEKLLARVAA